MKPVLASILGALACILFTGCQAMRPASSLAVAEADTPLLISPRQAFSLGTSVGNSRWVMPGPDPLGYGGYSNRATPEPEF